MPSRMFFIVTIGAIIVALAILGVVVLIQGDDEDQGGNVDKQPPPRSAPAWVTTQPAAGGYLSAT